MSDGITWANGVPVKIESWVSSELKAPYKIVRAGDYQDVIGEIIAADSASGDCTLNVPVPGSDPRAEAMKFGVDGIRIVRRTR